MLNFYFDRNGFVSNLIVNEYDFKGAGCRRRCLNDAALVLFDLPVTRDSENGTRVFVLI
ncbi:MAG: hypothetical protein ACP5MG_10730 [Verrucomicrobiia bacterium]